MYNLDKNTFGKGTLYENFADILSKNGNPKIISRVCYTLTHFNEKCKSLLLVPNKGHREYFLEYLYSDTRVQLEASLEYYFAPRVLVTHAMSVLHACHCFYWKLIHD